VLHWAAIEPAPGVYVWNGTKENDFDNIMKPARAEGLYLVVRLHGVPDWAGGSPMNADLAAVERTYENVARYGAGTVVAYEILNEPNLDREWGGPPDPAAYTAFMQAAYRGIKAGDPEALVLGGGPAPNTGNNPGATVEDYDFINGMYDAGAKGFMDALAVHSYGGNTEPELDPSQCTICFRRVELYRNVMVQRGDDKTSVWLTEWGYLLDPGQYYGQYDWMKVSAEQQADYIVRAHRYANQNWPWLTGSLLFNIDGAASPYLNYDLYDAKPWFSILNADYSPRPAWHAFQAWRASEAPAARSRRRGGERQETAAAQPQNQEASAAPPPPAASERLRVAGTDGTGVNLRTAPSLSASRIKTVPEGATLIALGSPRDSEGRSWRNVREPDGSEGWVAAEYVTPA
jgi:polysaccharide biosynthesis protein PslG